MAVARIPGLAATLSGFTSPSNDGEVTTSLQWVGAPAGGQSQLNNGRANTVFAGPFATKGATQLAFFLFNENGVDAYMRLRYFFDDDALAQFVDDTSILAGALAAGVQRWTLSKNDWQIPNTNGGGTAAQSGVVLLLPSVFRAFSVGIYSDGAVGGGKVTVMVQRAFGGMSAPVGV